MLICTMTIRRWPILQFINFDFEKREQRRKIRSEKLKKFVSKPLADEVLSYAELVSVSVDNAKFEANVLLRNHKSWNRKVKNKMCCYEGQETVSYVHALMDRVSQLRVNLGEETKVDSKNFTRNCSTSFVNEPTHPNPNV